MKNTAPRITRCLSCAVLGFLIQASGLSSEIEVNLTRSDPVDARPELFGFNCEIMLEVAFRDMTFDGEVMEAVVAELRPRALRFPGGTTANYYDWREDGYSEAMGDITGWAGAHVEMFRKEGKTLGLQGFIDLCRENAITPVYVFNVFADTPEGLCDFVVHVESLGGEVPIVEFANEPYWDPRALNNVAAYLEKTRPMARALKAFRPDTRIGVCLAPFGNPADYEKNWNASVMEEAEFDAVVFHEYHGKQGLATEASEALELDEFVHPETALDEMLAHLDRQAPGFPIWLTEYNIGFKHLDEFAYTGAHGIYLASLFSWLCEHGDRFELANYHQIYQVGFGTFFVDEETLEIRSTSSFYLWKMLGMVSLDRPGIHVPATNRRDLKVTVFEGEASIGFLVINRSGEKRTLKLKVEDVPMEGEWIRQTFAFADLTTKVPYDTDLTEVGVGTGPVLTVPGWSVTAIVLER